MNVFIAVPAGWTTVETGSETYIMYGESEEGDWPPIRVRLSVAGYDGDTRNASDVLAETEDLLSDFESTVLETEIIDDNQGWILLSMITDRGRPRTMLMAFSKNPEEGWFHTFAAFAYEDVFPHYYPIIRAMIRSWHGLRQPTRVRTPRHPQLNQHYATALFLASTSPQWGPERDERFSAAPPCRREAETSRTKSINEFLEGPRTNQRKYGISQAA